MSARIVTPLKPRKDPRTANARPDRYTNACRAGLRWVGDALGLLAMATLLAWLVVRFTY